MTLPTTGQISLGAIQTEFGGANPISIGEYKPGNGIVAQFTRPPGGLITPNNISLGQFRGASKNKALECKCMYLGPGTGSNMYIQIDAGNYTIQNQDRLVYCMKANAVPPGVSTLQTGIELRFTDGSYLTEKGLYDSKGNPVSSTVGIPTSYTNQWYECSIDLSPLAGLTLAEAAYYFTYGNTGGSLTYVTTQFANVMIIGSGYLRRAIFVDTQTVSGNLSMTGRSSKNYVPQTKTILDYV